MADALALSSGQDDLVVRRHAAAVPLGAAIGGASALAVVVGLVAAYLALRTGARSEGAWPPEGVHLDTYLFNTLGFGALIGIGLMEWATYAAQKALKGQAIFGYVMTAVLGGALVNGIAYALIQFPVAASDGAYGLITHALLAVALGIVAIGVGAVLIGAVRVAGGQATVARPEAARAVAIFWDLAMVAWIAVYYTVFIAK